MRQVNRWCLLGTAVLASPVLAEPSYLGTTGLLRTPTAAVLPEGMFSGAVHHHNPDPGLADSAQVYTAALGFWPGLELNGRLVEGERGGTAGIRDLSADLKYRFLEFPGGGGLAAGLQDYGGQNAFFRSRYLVATLPWRKLSASVGYGERDSALDGGFGGVQWQANPYLGLLADHVNRQTVAGLRLSTGDWHPRMNVSMTLSWNDQRHELEGGVALRLPLGRRPPAGGAPRRAAPPVEDDASLRSLAAHYRAAGFESVRVGERADGTVVAVIENRSYNHSAVDAVGVALAGASERLSPERRLELVLTSYQVPQLGITLPVGSYRDFREDGDGAALQRAWRVEAVDEIPDPAGVRWAATGGRLQAVEIIAEPLLRTFVGTEAGALDAALGARLRMVYPLSRGLLLTAGVQVPGLATDDLRDGGEYEAFAPETGIDHVLFQYFHKPRPAWSQLWSAGRTQVFQADLRVAALEQQWLSAGGRHQWRSKLMVLDAGSESATVALGGYTWFDAPRQYSVGLTAGRFLAGDRGGRLDVNRYFGDTIIGFYWRVAGRHEQVAGVQLSLPITPRRDMQPGRVQFKGARRWAWNLGTTINDATGSNPLRPLLAFEPMLDLDLRRDFFDAGRLNPDFLDVETSRLREAAALAADGG